MGGSEITLLNNTCSTERFLTFCITILAMSGVSILVQVFMVSSINPVSRQYTIVVVANPVVDWNEQLDPASHSTSAKSVPS